MKILLTGATGYIGRNLLQELLNMGHEVICCVRDTSRFKAPKNENGRLSVFQVDFSNPVTDPNAPADFDAAYYLLHSMSSSKEDFETAESRTANNFVTYCESTTCRQVIYLSGIVNDENLSKHLRSRKNVESILQGGRFATTILRAGIIVGAGSASFEIIRDLVEKLPVMIAPKWLKTRCQPISIKDVVLFLTGVLDLKETFNQTYDIGGPDILTYKEMLQLYAEVKSLKRMIITVPVMTPRLSSYWLYFVTSTSYALAVNLVDSMKVEVICSNNDLQELIKIEPLNYKQSVEEAINIHS